MKKIISVLMALLLLFSVSGCVFAADEKQTITFWYCMTDSNGQLIKSIIDDFNAGPGAERGIFIDAVYQGSYSDAVTKVNNIISGGHTENLPDILQMDATGKVMYASSGCGYTVDDMRADDPSFTLDDYMEAALMNWNYSGSQLGLPFATSTTVLYYNKTLLDSLGVSAPATFADFSAIAALLPEGITGYAAVPNTPLLANWLGQLGSDMVDLHNGSEGSATKLVCIENGALAAFLEAWKAMYQSGGVVNNSGSTDAFVAGTQVFMTSSTSSIASVTARIGGQFELGIAAFPQVNEDAAKGATVSGSCLAAYNVHPEHKEAIRFFLSYMTSADIQSRFAASSGYIPSVRSALDTDTWKEFISASPNYAVGAEQILSTPASMRSVTVGPAADFYYSIMTCVSDMLADDLSVEDTIDLMDEELNGLLYQYNLAN